jgi:hypothetical protein
VEAQLEAEKAEQARQHDKPFLGILERASMLAAEAAEKVPERADLWLLVGQICLQRADALAAAERPEVPPGPTVEQGLRAVEQALERAPGMPRALAAFGALSLHEARLDPAREAAALQRARESFSQAFAGNPLLRRRYGEAAAEVERRLEKR